MKEAAEERGMEEEGGREGDGRGRGRKDEEEPGNRRAETKLEEEPGEAWERGGTGIYS